MERRSKIVATLGPASRGERKIARLLEAGMDVARLNLSHGTHEEHGEVTDRVRRQAARLGRHVPVIVDLMGPRYRLGRLEEARKLKRGEEVRLGAAGAGAELPVDEEEIIAHLRPGERVLVDNGLVELRIETVEERRALARVVHGGTVSTRKGINLPDSDLPFTISDKDRADIAFAVARGADYLAASYVGRAEHLEALRRAVAEAGDDLPLVAKLERAQAVEHLEEIVEAADAIMVARGDLGVEVPVDQVPVLQKRILAAGRRAGKPVIVATQMLESMVHQPRPTRAEVTDVANAVFDGADALMLSGETAAGHHPLEAVRTMDRTIRQAEAYRDGSPDPLFLLGGAQGALGAEPASATAVPDAVSAAAVHAAGQLPVRHIVAFSQGGFTIRLIARYRPAAPILAFTTDEATARRSQLVWGVRPFVLESEVEHHDEVVEVVDRQLLATRLAEAGDIIVILMGDPIRERPLTNLMRIHRVRSG